jgi:penicillin-binding protein 1A
MTLKKFLNRSLITLFSLSIIGLIACYIAYNELNNELPDVQILKDIEYKQPLRIYSSDKLLIEQFGEDFRIPITIDNIPQQLIEAFISSEDATFFTHSGVDYKGLARAIIQLALTGKKKQGGSTITMQVAKNFLLSNEKTYIRKIKEILLAFKIEDEFSKNEILELYVNKIYLGKRSYGIAAAAEIYYHRPLSELTLAELAMIAGLPKAPSSNNPISNPDRALIRRNYVLNRMLKLKHINMDEYTIAHAAKITARPVSKQRELHAPYIAEMVRNKIIELYGEHIAYTKGLKVYTTLNSTLQNTATHALRTNLHHYDERHSYRINNDNQSLATTPNIGDTLVAQVTFIEKEKLTARLKDGTEVTLLWKDAPYPTSFIKKRNRTRAIHSFLDILKLGSIIRTRKENDTWKLAQNPTAQSAFIALNPNNGAILALSGGYSFFNNKYNRVTQAKRQPGSGFKPIIYAAALENGYTLASLINDAPIVNDNSLQDMEWRPENYNHKFYGPISIRTALRLSRNLISIRLLRSLSIPTVRDTAFRFNFSPEQIPKKLSLALGSGYASPLDMARVFSVFANGGFLIQPYFIDHIESSKGEIMFQANPAIACAKCRISSPKNLASRIMSRPINFLMNSLLRDVVRRGTATEAKSLQRTDLAGKTGTTNNQKDAWFNGFTKDIVGIAWVGRDDYKSLGSWETGGKAALPLWIDFMRVALQNKPEQKLLPPIGIKKVLIDKKTSLLSQEKQASDFSFWEFFRPQYIPTKYAPKPFNSLDLENTHTEITEELF